MKSSKESFKGRDLIEEGGEAKLPFEDEMDWLQKCEELGLFEPAFIERIVTRMEYYARLH